MNNIVMKKVSGSGPANQYSEAANKVVPKPTHIPGVHEISLQRLDGTNVFQWHYRTGVYWQSYGDLMIIDEKATESES